MVDERLRVNARYKPEVFETGDVGSAKNVILTSNYTMNSAQRWEVETPYLQERLGEDLQLCPEDVVLDYGCGIGRLAKVIIEKYGCAVVGVDISTSMRTMALEYVNSPRFSVESPESFDNWIASGRRVDKGYAVWVIQHVLNPSLEIGRITSSLKKGGLFFLLNAPSRCVPSNLGWANDGVDIFRILVDRGFLEAKSYLLPIYPKDENPATHPSCKTYVLE
jgi:cyclopropane fatty-acyl-phospholipid synthase-like methyltransferase